MTSDLAGPPPPAGACPGSASPQQQANAGPPRAAQQPLGPRSTSPQQQADAGPSRAAQRPLGAQQSGSGSSSESSQQSSPPHARPHHRTPQQPPGGPDTTQQLPAGGPRSRHRKQPGTGLCQQQQTDTAPCTTTTTTQPPPRAAHPTRQQQPDTAPHPTPQQPQPQITSVCFVLPIQPDKEAAAQAKLLQACQGSSPIKLVFEGRHHSLGHTSAGRFMTGAVAAAGHQGLTAVTHVELRSMQLDALVPPWLTTTCPNMTRLSWLQYQIGNLQDPITTAAASPITFPNTTLPTTTTTPTHPTTTAFPTTLLPTSTSHTLTAAITPTTIPSTATTTTTPTLPPTSTPTTTTTIPTTTTPTTTTTPPATTILSCSQLQELNLAFASCSLPTDAPTLAKLHHQILHTLPGLTSLSISDEVPPQFLHCFSAQRAPEQFTGASGTPTLSTGVPGSPALPTGNDGASILPTGAAGAPTGLASQSQLTQLRLVLLGASAQALDLHQVCSWFPSLTDLQLPLTTIHDQGTEALLSLQTLRKLECKGFQLQQGGCYAHRSSPCPWTQLSCEELDAQTLERLPMEGVQLTLTKQDEYDESDDDSV